MSSDEDHTDDGASVGRRSFAPHQQRTPNKQREVPQQQNAQDPDTTDMNTDNEASQYIHTAIGFFKNFQR